MQPQQKLVDIDCSNLVWVPFNACVYHKPNSRSSVLTKQDRLG